MLAAYTEQNELFILNSSMPLATLHLLRKSKKFYCPLCKQQLLFKIGSLKIPHFSHFSKSHCDDFFSERESETHLKGKEQLYNLFKALNLDAKLEAYITTIQQRPDILLKDDDNSMFAIEFQCSSISKESLIRRNTGYREENISPVWIPNTPTNITRSGIQKISLSKNVQQFTLCSKHLPYIMTYNPTVRQFFYISNLIFLQGNSFLSKVQTISVTHQQFPFYIPKPITPNEFKQFLLIYKQVKHNYVQKRVLLSRSGVNDIFLRRAYELRLNLLSLPYYIGIPLIGNEELQVFSVDWQLALFYFVYTTKIELRHMKGQTIYYFLRWAKLPETSRAKDVVSEYCRLLEELSVQHSYQSIHEKKLFDVLYNHFLAI